MNANNARARRRTKQASAAPNPFLTGRDMERLTRFKWLYSLEAHGFSSSQAARLLFTKWRYGRGDLVE
jgi:hypothetical protein